MATMTKLSVLDANRVTGLIPAAGRGSRLPNLPCSKELLPVPDADDTAAHPAIEYSVRFLLDCGIEQQHVVIARGKKDIADFLGDGRQLGARISYSVITDSPGVPYSLDAAREQIGAATVILVFPDIMFEPRAEIAARLARFSARESDVLLPLVPSTRGDKVDLVSVEVDGRVTGILPKPGAGHSGFTWVAAAWSRAFTSFLHRFLRDAATKYESATSKELYVGDVLNAAIAKGLSVRAEIFAEGHAIDIGTPDDFAAIWRQSSQDTPPLAAAVLRGF
jgi:glucose-1-phosphate thymidylyltransferase